MMKRYRIFLLIAVISILLTSCRSLQANEFEKQSGSGEVTQTVTEKTEMIETESETENHTSMNEDELDTEEKSSVISDSEEADGKKDSTVETSKNQKEVNSATKSTTATAQANQTTTKKAETQATTEKKTTAAQTTTQTTTVQTTTVPMTIKVSLSVDCINAYNAGNEIAVKISNNGYILGATAFEVDQNTTALDLLLNSGLTVSTNSGPFGTYVVSIQSLAEYAVDGQGGWLYLVNGQMPNVAASAYVLQPGDIIEFRYTVKNGDV